MFILDTNVVSELRKVSLGKADANVQKWASICEARYFHLSAITIHELEIGILRLKHRKEYSSRILRRWLDEHVLQAFDGRIFPVDVAIAQRSAALHIPQTRPWADAFIAATALTHNLVVVTRNVQDFKPLGVTVLNPWLQ